MFQQVFCILYDESAYPVGYGMTADFPDGCGKVPRSQVHAVCIPAYFTFCRVVFTQELDEPVEVPAQELESVPREGFNLVEWGGAGATVPLTGFGHNLAKGVKKAVAEQGLLGAFTGYFGGKADLILMRINDAVAALKALIGDLEE